MDTRYVEDGDPYAPDERRRPLVRPWVWAAGAAAAVGIMAYLWFPRQWEQVPVLDEKTTLTIPQPVWNGYQAHPEPKLQPAAFERPVPDPRIEAMQREMQALRDKDARQETLLRELLAKKEATPPQAPGPAPASTTPAPTPERPRHRDMGYLAFAQPEAPAEAEPLYALAPGDTKLLCTVESAMNSSVESIATVKITTNTYDTETRRRLLIPQGATILTKYYSKDLLYGAQRLPITSTVLTLPNGKTVTLDEPPVLDEIGQAGLVTDIDHRFWTALPAVLIRGVLQGTQQTITTTGNPLAAGVAGSTAQFGTRVTQPFIDLRPIITVSAGEECIVILTKALKLPEYREARASSR